MRGIGEDNVIGEVNSESNSKLVTEGGGKKMGVIKQIAWNTFKNTGSIDTFLELMQVEDAEKNTYRSSINEEAARGFLNGNSENKWNNNSRK